MGGGGRERINPVMAMLLAPFTNILYYRTWELDLILHSLVAILL